MLCLQETAGRTNTSEGLIQYKKHPLGFEMPVKLAVKSGGAKAMKELQPPLRDERGNLIFALPGGGSFVDA